MPTLLVALLLSSPDAGVVCDGCVTFQRPADALESVLQQQPSILGVGEYHEVRGAPKVRSAIARFTTELLPALAGHVKSLVVETWMLSGRCGAVEKQAASAVEQTTRRPQSTEDEVTTLLDRSYSMGVKNHTLLINCDDYRSMLDDAGSLDAEASLRLVRRKVEERSLAVREAAEGGVPGRLLVLYGGALHNDLYPDDTMAAFSFGPALARETGDRYVELDLLVPEYVDRDVELLRLPWFRPALALARRGKTVLVSPRSNAFVLIFAYSKRP